MTRKSILDYKLKIVTVCECPDCLHRVDIVAKKRLSINEMNEKKPRLESWQICPVCETRMGMFWFINVPRKRREKCK